MVIAITMKNPAFGIDYLKASLKKSGLFFYCVFSPFIFYGQQLEWGGKTEALAVIAENQNPFWFYTNTENAFGANSNFSVTAEITALYPISEKAKLSGKLSFFYRDNILNEFQRKESFLRFSNTWLRISAGAFSTINKEAQLSVSNKNFLFSGNSRPMPGFLAEAVEPTKISSVFSIDWGIGHYFLNDSNRFVKNTWVHYKRLGLYTQLSENHKLHLQLQHYAQWAGTSPIYGDLKDDFEAFIDVFTARKSAEKGVEGEILNAVGNHLGSYLFDYYYTSTFGTLNLYHEHPFEDGSGTAWKNFPDGIWGVGFKPSTSKYIKNVVYEFIETSDQSGNTTDSGFDGYFGNNIYRSGWVYENNFIGLPLLLYNPFLELNETNTPFISNRLKAHHIGVSGSFLNFNWELKTTWVKNLGTYRHPLPEPLKSWNNYLLLEYPTQKYGSFKFLSGFDSSNLNNTNWSIGVGYLYTVL